MILSYSLNTATEILDGFKGLQLKVMSGFRIQVTKDSAGQFGGA
ncbi:MAG: hypothetical protein ACK6D4_21735 [Planctomyces sp.]